MWLSFSLPLPLLSYFWETFLDIFWNYDPCAKKFIYAFQSGRNINIVSKCGKVHSIIASHVSD